MSAVLPLGMIDWRASFIKARGVSDEVFFDLYDKYLQSPYWLNRREKVLRRANGICEGCLTRPATMVHHLTYEHIGDELLFELRAICGRCHEKCHEGSD
jgi:5-methylcytosine-specific restriction endonuclease McrA